MKFHETNLKGCYTIDIEPTTDERGWFARTYCKKEFMEIDHNKEWVQINHSFTQNKGTIRGMHYQLSPHREIKLIRCVSGVVYDVVVDLRKNSATFLKWFGFELSSLSKKMIYIPEGFAHGFQALTDQCELIYHHSSFYNTNFEGGIKFDDPKINISWILDPIHISHRDLNHPLITENFKGV